MSTEHNKKGNRLYFMNDKNIRDGLLAHRVKTEHLISLLLNKGVIVAQDSNKSTLLEILQTMRFDYHDYVYLSAILENPDRRDSQSTTELPTKCTAVQVTEALKNVTKICSNDEIDVSIKLSGKKAKVEFNYVDIDYSKAPMRQRTPKKGVLEIDFSSGDDTSIRFPATDVGKKVKDQLITEITRNLGQELKPIEIDFEHSSPKTRTDFFTKLISLPGYSVYDVVVVSVRNAGGEDNESDFTGQVRRAALSGKGLLTSEIYKSFPSKEYNIFKIVWKVQQIDVGGNSDKSDCYLVEAKFDDIKNSNGFSYQVKSVQRYNESRNSLNSTPVKPEKLEADELAKVLFNTAATLYTELTSGS